MGNTQDKSKYIITSQYHRFNLKIIHIPHKKNKHTLPTAHGGRGQPLGTSTDPTPTKKKKKFQTKKSYNKQQQKAENRMVNRAVREADIREQRLKNVNLNNKNVYVSSELKKKEKMLHIMNAADAKAHGQQAPTAPKHMQHEKPTTSISPNKSSGNNKGNLSQSSLYMVDPSSKEALAAEKRIQQKTLKKVKNIDERKNRTRDLLFGDGLKEKEEEFDVTQYNDGGGGGSGGGINKTAQFYKSDKDVPLSSNSNTASAALKRFDKQKSGKIVNKKDRQNRTMELLHGDLLKDQNEVKAEPRQQTYNDDIV